MLAEVGDSNENWECISVVAYFCLRCYINPSLERSLIKAFRFPVCVPGPCFSTWGGYQAPAVQGRTGELP